MLRKTLFLLLYTALCAAASAQQSPLFTAADLPSIDVHALCQDSYGFLWVGTEHGLARYDGYRFTPYTHSRRNTLTLPSDNVCALLTRRDGSLWAGCGKGLARYDYARDRFLRIPFPGGLEPRVGTLVEDAAGRLFVGTAGYGVFVMEPTADTLLYATSMNGRTRDMYFTHLYIDARGGLWSSSHDVHFYRHTLSGGNCVATQGFEVPGGSSPEAFLDWGHDTTLIVCPETILAYSHATHTLTTAPHCLPPGVVPRSAQRTAARRLLIGSPALEDRDGNIWESLPGRGLALSRQKRSAFGRWELPEEAVGQGVLAMARDDDGGVWVATRSARLVHFDAYGRVAAIAKVPDGTSIVFRDACSRYWLAAGNTLYRFTPGSGAVAVSSFEGGGIWALCSAPNGRLYVSTFGLGFCEFDPETGETTAFSASADSPHGRLVNNWVGAIATDAGGLVWLSTADGLSCMSSSDHRFDVFGREPLLRGTGCGPLCVMADGNVAVGTPDGLYLCDRASHTARPFPDAEALEDQDICAIQRDSADNLWVATLRGLWRYDIREHRFTNYTADADVHGEYNLYASLMLADGRLVFGDAEGLTAFRPADVQHAQLPPAVPRLVRFESDGRLADFRQSSFEVGHDVTAIALSFSALDFADIRHLHLRYRLANGPWTTTASGDATITLAHMQPGTYTLNVCYERGGQQSEPCVVHLRVLPPWYRTVWAYVLYVLLGLALLALALWLYIRRQRAALDEEKMRFLINATHDIRSPLTIILSAARQLRDGGSGDPEAIGAIERGAQRLQLLAGQILDQRKIDKQLMQLRCRETDLVDFISGICRLYQYPATQRDITFTFEHERDHLMAWIDRTQFDKVVSNLLSNAFKYTPDGGEVTLKCGTSASGSLLLTIQDTGIGLQDEHPERLFDRFYQGKTGQNLGIQGTGIGLNLARSIVQMHGGTITARNRTDGRQGAEFEVRLPLGSSHLRPEQIVTDEQTREVVAAPARAKTPTTPVRILLVDDDRELADYIAEQLSPWYRFTYQSNGREALKTLLTQPDRFDLVISDVMMSEMDGLTLLGRIKENPQTSQLPVILLTSKTEVADKLEGLRHGADAYIAKPFQMEELRVQIDNLMAAFRRLRGKFSGALQQEERVEAVEVRGNDDALMQRIMQSVNAHLDDTDYSVETLAAEAGLSRAHLHRKLKEITGVSAARFIRNIRLEQAARVLQQGHINVEQVAFATGFNDSSYFSTVFKAQYGQTPSEYSRNHKAEGH